MAFDVIGRREFLEIFLLVLFRVGIIELLVEEYDRVGAIRSPTKIVWVELKRSQSTVIVGGVPRSCLICIDICISVNIFALPNRGLWRGDIDVAE